MDFRIFTEPQQGASHEDQLRVAKAAEDLGYDAYFRSDHYLAMGVPGLPGPSDAWLTLAALARETSRIRLGTLVTPATFRLPGPLAISVAQVDQMSGGRAELGLGAGWFGAEHAAYGIPFPDMGERFDRFAEQVEIIDGLLSTTDAGTYSFDGKHYQLTDSPALPKPVQSPRPPIILGGSGKKRSAALAARAAQLRSVELVAPRSPIGKNTVESLQSGILYGFAGQVDGMVRRLSAALVPSDPASVEVIATGGLARLVIDHSETVTRYEPELTLIGLRLIYERNL